MDETVKPLTIILVEDDDLDAKMVRRALTKARIANPFFRVEDGIEALELLRSGKDGIAVQKPYVLFVDLNMPRMGGLELIQALRSDPALKKTTVFVLTTSKRGEDIDAAYDLNVAGYIIKETAGRDFLSLLDLIDGYQKIIVLPE